MSSTAIDRRLGTFGPMGAQACQEKLLVVQELNCRPQELPRVYIRDSLALVS